MTLNLKAESFSYYAIALLIILASILRSLGVTL
jgi:hypothetical protein